MHSARFVATALVALTLSLPTHLAAQPADSVVAATVNDEQVDRGEKLFGKTCVECHTRNDMSSPDFRLKWNTRPVFDLFERIRTTMPDVAPGSLTRDEYIDVVTYFLKLNGAPAGGMPLPPDSAALRKVRIDIAAKSPSSLSSLFTPYQPLHR